MAHVTLELARDRNESMLAAAAMRRDGQRAMTYSRLVRQARRAQDRTLSHADEVQRLRARIAQIEAGG